LRQWSVSSRPSNNGVLTDATVELLCDDENNLKAVYYQDVDMKKSYEAWPEFICMDSTYKLLQLQMSVFILLC